MRKQKFALTPGGPKDLEVSWRGWWLRPKLFIVKLAGREVARVEPTKDELATGVTVRLPDDSGLTLRWNPNWARSYLEVERYGRPLPGSATDPARQFKWGVGVLAALGAIRILLPMAAVVLKSESLRAMSGGWLSFGEGVCFAVVAVAAHRTRKKIWFAVGLGVYVVEWIGGLIYVLSTHGDGRFVTGMGAGNGLWVRAMVIYTLWQAYKATDRLREPPPGEAAAKVFE